MKLLIRAVALAAVLLVPTLASAEAIRGDVSGGGSVSGVVTRDDAWVESNPSDGTEVNFWTLTANAGDTLSVYVSSLDIEFGISLYQGLVDDSELLLGFNNTADFGDNTFVASTPSYTATGTSLLSIVLLESGTYTLAVGGEDGGHSYGTFAYNMDVNVAPVPVPAAIWLLVSGLMGMGVLRRRA